MASFGSAMPFVGLGLLLLFWGSRQVRREHFGKMNLKVALLLNSPAILFMLLGTATIITTLIMSLK